MDKDDFKQVVQNVARDLPHEYLDRPENTQKVSRQIALLNHEKVHGTRNAIQDLLLEAQFLKANMFACLYTSPTSALHKENMAALKKGRRKFVRSLIGDARLSLEEAQDSFLAQMQQAETTGEENMLRFAFTQAVGTQVGLDRLMYLRVDMATNFYDPDFINLDTDCKLPSYDL